MEDHPPKLPNSDAQCIQGVFLSCRLSLGIPSSLLLSGLDLGTKCIREIVPDSGAGARVIMEAGYMLLGAMCIALPQDVMDVSMHRLLNADAPMPLTLLPITYTIVSGMYIYAFISAQYCILHL